MLLISMLLKLFLSSKLIEVCCRNNHMRFRNNPPVFFPKYALRIEGTMHNYYAHAHYIALETANAYLCQYSIDHTTSSRLSGSHN
jgi:hypothetical protein